MNNELTFLDILNTITDEDRAKWAAEEAARKAATAAQRAQDDADMAAQYEEWKREVVARGPSSSYQTHRMVELKYDVI